MAAPCWSRYNWSVPTLSILPSMLIFFCVSQRFGGSSARVGDVSLCLVAFLSKIWCYTAIIAGEHFDANEFTVYLHLASGLARQFQSAHWSGGTGTTTRNVCSSTVLLYCHWTITDLELNAKNITAQKKHSGRLESKSSPANRLTRVSLLESSPQWSTGIQQILHWMTAHNPAHMILVDRWTEGQTARLGSSGFRICAHWVQSSIPH